MELTQLQYFVTVAKTGNLSRAAEKLYITQSALSRSVAKLESELGMQLFDRNGGRLVLNAAGEEFLTYAKQSLETLNSGVQSLKQQMDCHVIHMADYGATGFFPQIQDRCQMRYPIIDVTLKTYEELSRDRGILPADTDIVLTPEENLDGFTQVMSYPEKWVVISNKQYIFRSDYTSGPITAGQLSKESLVFFGTPADREFQMSLHGEPALFIDCGEIRETARAVNRCKAVGMIPAANLGYLFEQKLPLRYIPIADPRAARMMYLQRSDTFPQGADYQGFLGAAAEYIREHIPLWESYNVLISNQNS